MIIVHLYGVYIDESTIVYTSKFIDHVVVAQCTYVSIGHHYCVYIDESTIVYTSKFIDHMVVAQCPYDKIPGVI